MEYSWYLYILKRGYVYLCSNIDLMCAYINAYNIYMRLGGLEH